jgi:hypothetical protein
MTETINQTAEQTWNNATGEQKVAWVKELGYEFCDEEKVKQRTFGSFNDTIQNEISDLICK